METVFDIGELEIYDNLKDIMNLKDLKLHYLPFPYNLNEQIDTMKTLNKIDKRFKKESENSKHVYIAAILEKMFIEYLKEMVFPYYLEQLCCSCDCGTKIYFIYNDLYIDTYFNKAYKRNNKKEFKTVDFDFTTIKYEDITKLLVITSINKKDINKHKKQLGTTIKKHNKQDIYKDFISCEIYLRSIIEDFIDNSIDFEFEIDFFEDKFGGWTNFVDYDEFKKEYA